MLNKNVADYTNFDGKTNKRIVHAPGGDTHFSLAWSNQKTDYGPERNIRKKDNYPQYNQPTNNYNPPSSQKPNNFNYNEPIRVMNDRAHEQQSYPEKQEMYSVHSVQSSTQSQSSKKYGGEYGYNNYPQEDNYKQPKAQYYQQDSLDQKIQEEQKGRSSIPNNIPRPQNSNIKPSIKIHEQKSNMILGDNSYNYWHDNPNERRSSNQSNKRPPIYQQPISQFPQQQSYPEKTSVKVHNPPGGKSSISFG